MVWKFTLRLLTVDLQLTSRPLPTSRPSAMLTPGGLKNMQFSTKLLSRMATVCLAAFGLFLSSLVAYGQQPLPDRSVPVVTVGGMQYDRPYPPAFSHQNVNDQMERQMDQMFREAALQRQHTPSPQPRQTAQQTALQPHHHATPAAPQKPAQLQTPQD